MAADDREEQYLLRVQDRGLAQRLTRLLRDDAAARPDDANIELTFDHGGTGDEGVFTVGGEAFPVHLRNLPTIVESYKTYDDIHLVKSNDIGQVLLVPEKGAAVAEGQEWRHGVTPPMRDARARHFRQHPDVHPALVAKTEQDLLAILAGGAPDGVEYTDLEEEYIVDENGVGSWQPARPLVKAAPAPKTAARTANRKPPGPRSKKGKAAAAAAAAAAAEAEGSQQQKQQQQSAAQASTPEPSAAEVI